MKSKRQRIQSEQADRAALIEKYRLHNPSVAITIDWKEEPYFIWDGDAPEPDDMLPHYVTVTVTTIANGQIVTGSDMLGGCYSADGGADDPMVGGYLPQMIDAAYESLLDNLKSL